VVHRERAGGCAAGAAPADMSLQARAQQAIDAGLRHQRAHRAPDASIVVHAQGQSDNTALAIGALAATHDPKYAPLAAAGQKYIVGTQIGKSRGFAPVDSRYGTVGCGGDERPDVSNLYVAPATRPALPPGAATCP